MIKQLKNWISNKDNRSTLIMGVVSVAVAIGLIWVMFSVHY